MPSSNVWFYSVEFFQCSFSLPSLKDFCLCRCLGVITPQKYGMMHILGSRDFKAQEIVFLMDFLFNLKMQSPTSLFEVGCSEELSYIIQREKRVLELSIKPELSQGLCCERK